MSESGGDGGAGPDTSRPDVGGTGGTGGAEPGQRRSGLRDPEAAVRGVGAAALGVQAVVLLLAIVPLRVIGAAGPVAIGVMAALAVGSLVLAGLLRHPWAWWVAGAPPLVLIGSGFVVHLSLLVAGVVLGFIWLYVLRVRATVLGDRGHSTR